MILSWHRERCVTLNGLPPDDSGGECEPVEPKMATRATAGSTHGHRVSSLHMVGVLDMRGSLPVPVLPKRFRPTVVRGLPGVTSGDCC